MIAFPFDFNPIRTERKTGVYEIPAGEYALVKPISLATDLTIDGEVAFEKLIFQGSDPGTSQGVKFTNTTDKFLVGHMSQSSSASHHSGVSGGVKHLYTNIPMTTATDGSDNTISVILKPGDTINCLNANGIPQTISWSLAVLNPDSRNGGIWVKSGTEINGTAYTVEIFKNKT